MNSSEKRERRFLLTTLALGHMTNDWVAGSIWLIAPAAIASMGLGPAEVGLMLAIHGLGAGLGYIPAGIVADRMRQQGILMLITFWWVAIGYFCATLAPGFWSVTLLFALAVMGDAFWHPVATGVLVKRMPERRAEVLGIHAMGGSIGAEVLGPLTAGLLLGFMDWRSSLQVITIPAVLAGIFFVFFISRFSIHHSSTTPRVKIRSLLATWSGANALGLLLLITFYNMALFAILSMTPLILQSDHGLTPASAGVLFASMLLLGTLMQPFLGRLSDRTGRKSITLWTMVLSTVFCLFASLASDLLTFILFLLISVSLLTAIRPVLLASAVEHSGKSEATTLGIAFALLDGVGALGALFGGYVGEYSLSYVYLLAAGFGLISSILTLFVRFTFTVSGSNTSPRLQTPV